MPFNLATCAVVNLSCDRLSDGQITHIGIYIWGKFVLTPSQVSVQPPFLRRSSSKNEVPPVPIHPKEAPSTRFVHSTGLVNNPLISPRFWNSMVDRYAIVNWCVDVLMTPIKQSPRFQNSSASGTDAKYESAQPILSMIAHGITSSFNTFVPVEILSLSSS